MEYTEVQWRREMEAPWVSIPSLNGFAFGTLIPCPDCKTVGFYGPRLSPDQDRKYRACKFCGFWQEIGGTGFNEHGGEPYRCIMIRCAKCGLYDWRLPWGASSTDFGSCANEKCRGKEFDKVPWPAEDPKHPFNATRDLIRRYL